jgi:hypothetical protein
MYVCMFCYISSVLVGYLLFAVLGLFLIFFLGSGVYFCCFWKWICYDIHFSYVVFIFYFLCVVFILTLALLWCVMLLVDSCVSDVSVCHGFSCNLLSYISHIPEAHYLNTLEQFPSQITPELHLCFFQKPLFTTHWKISCMPIICNKMQGNVLLMLSLYKD